VKYKIHRRIIWTITVFILPPLLAGYLHINAITIKESNSSLNLAITTISRNFDISEPFKLSIKASEDLGYKIDQISRYPFLDIQPNIIRHTAYIGHNIHIRFSYTEIDYSSDDEVDVPGELFCREKFIKPIIDKNSQNTIIAKGLLLNRNEANNQKDLEKIISNCVLSAQIAFQNNLGRVVLINLDSIRLVHGGVINLIVRPDFLSQVSIYIGWLIFWIGFLIMLREGPIKYLKV